MIDIRVFMELVLLLDLVVALEVVVEALAHFAEIRADEPYSNIVGRTAVEVLHLPQSVCAKDDAP